MLCPNAAKCEDAEDDLGHDAFGDLFSHIRMIYRNAKPQGTLLKESTNAGVNDRIERFSRLTTAVKDSEAVSGAGKLWLVTSALQLSKTEQYATYVALSGAVYADLAARSTSTLLLRLDSLAYGRFVVEDSRYWLFVRNQSLCHHVVSFSNPGVKAPSTIGYTRAPWSAAVFRQPVGWLIFLASPAATPKMAPYSAFLLCLLVPRADPSHSPDAGTPVGNCYIQSPAYVRGVSTRGSQADSTEASSGKRVHSMKWQ